MMHKIIPRVTPLKGNEIWRVTSSRQMMYGWSNHMCYWGSFVADISILREKNSSFLVTGHLNHSPGQTKCAELLCPGCLYVQEIVCNLVMDCASLLPRG